MNRPAIHRPCECQLLRRGPCRRCRGTGWRPLTDDEWPAALGPVRNVGLAALPAALLGVSHASAGLQARAIRGHDKLLAHLTGNEALFAFGLAELLAEALAKEGRAAA